MRSKCTSCKSTFERKTKQTREYSYCSTSCQLKHEYSIGKRNKYKITKVANDTLRTKGQYTRDNTYLSVRSPARLPESRKKNSESKRGSKNPMYGKINELHPRFKNYSRRYIKRNDWKEIKEKAKMRDKFTCKSCGIKEEEQIKKYKQALQVHHLIPFEECQKHELSNLATLCSKCHGLCKNQEFNNNLKVVMIDELKLSTPLKESS